MTGGWVLDHEGTGKETDGHTSFTISSSSEGLSLKSTMCMMAIVDSAGIGIGVGVERDVFRCIYERGGSRKCGNDMI
jgi:hypothetical protein